jgi:phage terminase small subunit
MRKDELTPKQERFVQELLRGKSQRQAYRAAYSAERMSDSAVDVAATRLFNRAKVTLRFSELQQQAVKEAVKTRADVIRELERIAFANTTDFVDTDGNYVYIVPTDAVPEHKLPAIASIKQTKDGIEIKTHDKVRALDILLAELDSAEAAADKDDGFIDAMKAEAGELWQDGEDAE